MAFISLAALIARTVEEMFCHSFQNVRENINFIFLCLSGLQRQESDRNTLIEVKCMHSLSY